PHRVAAFVSPRSHRNSSPGCSRFARFGGVVSHCDTQSAVASRHFLCNGAKTFGEEWETVCVSGLPRTKATNPKPKRKSNYENQKNPPDLHPCRVLHLRDLGEFIAGRASAPASAKLHR